jgi:DNA-directed RNA polymerase specialized sigma24 family protein
VPWADGRDLDLASAVARRAAKQKLAVAYHYLAGLPYAEVAEIIGGTADAARRAAADGIAALRRSCALSPKGQTP